MEIHTRTKNLLSILPMISDFCWWCTMSHSASQYATCTTRSIKNPNLHPKISRKFRLLNTTLPIIAPLVRRTYLSESWFTHWLSSLTLKLGKVPSHHLINFQLFILPLHQSLVASENMQHKRLLSTAIIYDPKHY